MNIVKKIGKNYPVAAILAALSLLFAVAMVFSRGTGHAFPLTILASCKLVLAGAAGGAHKHGFGRFMFAGILLCFMGDLLGVYDFVWGALAFLLAHIAFIAAFLMQGVRLKTSVSSTVPALLVGAGISFWLLPHVPHDEWNLVIAYMVIISVMLILAAGTAIPQGATLIIAGAILFYISDIFVARWHYVTPSPINAYFCYPLYYSACVLLALSISARSLPLESG